MSIADIKNWFSNLFSKKDVLTQDAEVVVADVEKTVVDVEKTAQDAKSISGPRDRTNKTHNSPHSHYYGHGNTNNGKVK